ncbi:MAG: hypothetical protein JWP10_1565 [Nocardioidaceae bacterium]|nr:hypothetical protein [Nocardioidaceae bacterium]
MWAALGQSNQPVSYQLHSYDVVSESQITLKVELHRDDPSKPATCSVYAQANDHSTVGEKTFDVPPSTDKTVFADTTLQTERRAVTGLVRRCELAN